jgi:hypothetical protein
VDGGLSPGTMDLSPSVISRRTPTQIVYQDWGRANKHSGHTRGVAEIRVPLPKRPPAAAALDFHDNFAPISSNERTSVDFVGMCINFGISEIRRAPGKSPNPLQRETFHIFST